MNYKRKISYLKLKIKKSFIKNRPVIIFGGCLMLFILAFLLYQTLRIPRLDPNKTQVALYFYNPLTLRLEPEFHQVDKNENFHMAAEVLELLYQGPKSGNLNPTAPEGLRHMAAGKPADGASELEIVFPEAYMGITPLEEIFFRGSLVWTLTELDFIDNIRIFVEEQELTRANGQPMGVLNRDNIVIDMTISPDKVNNRRIALYFRDGEKEELAVETRIVQAPANPTDTQPVERIVMEQLIAGPLTADLLPTVPPETRIRDVQNSEDICYVNLSSEFVSRQPSDPDILRLNIYSIVNSLTDSGNVSKVKFLIESEQIDELGDGFDISKPLDPLSPEELAEFREKTER